MPALTLPQHIARTKEKLVKGVAEEILSINPWYLVCPWTGYEGSGIIVNKESAIGDADFYDLGDTITSKAPSGTVPVTFRSTRVIGDAELDGLQIAESTGTKNSVMALEIASKAKSVGRKIQTGIATGSGANPAMNSFHSMVDSGQYVQPTGGTILDDLDALTMKVLSKDSFVDFIMITPREALKFRTAMRASGGVPMMEIKSGNRTMKIMEFNGIPVFVNSFLPVTETATGAALTGGALSSMYAGNFDDGTQKVGVSLIHPISTPAGISVKPIGEMETKDQEIFRVKAYCNFASFNKMGVARMTDIAA